MLGKAVKLRHCPATVSATASWSISLGQGRTPARVFPQFAEVPHQPLEANPPGLLLGRSLEKAQVRRPVLASSPAYVPRGTKEPMSCPFHHSGAHNPAASMSCLFAAILFSFCSPLPARPRPSTAWSPTPPAQKLPAPLWCSSTTDKPSPRPSPQPTAVFRFSPESKGASTWSSRPRAFANWKRRASTPAAWTMWNATWCWSRRGCASPSWSRQPAFLRRSRRPVRRQA